MYFENNVFVLFWYHGVNINIPSWNWNKMKSNTWNLLYICQTNWRINLSIQNANLFVYIYHVLPKWQMNIKTMEIFTTIFHPQSLSDYQQSLLNGHASLVINSNLSCIVFVEYRLSSLEMKARIYCRSPHH